MKLIESRALPPRRRYFVAVLVQTTAFVAFSILVAKLNWIQLFPAQMPPVRAILAGFVFLAIAIPFGWMRWRKAVEKRRKIAALFMPANVTERALWVGTAFVAGVGEEITWRRVQTVLLSRLTGDFIAAIAICIVMFALAHAIQGWTSVAVIVVFAAGFHLLVYLAGSLYVAMAVHFIYDLVAGFAYGHLGRKLGYRPPETAGAPTPVPATDSV
jgi:membrane protease YdiL (CAAX protease family)